MTPLLRILALRNQSSIQPPMNGSWREKISLPIKVVLKKFCKKALKHGLYTQGALGHIIGVKNRRQAESLFMQS